jgi:hypothetical protein
MSTWTRILSNEISLPLSPISYHRATLYNNLAGMVAALHGTPDPEHSRTLCSALMTTGAVGVLGGAARLEETPQYS